jgi:hypothetical protein
MFHFSSNNAHWEVPENYLTLSNVVRYRVTGSAVYGLDFQALFLSA